MTDKERDALLLELKSAITDIGIIVLAMADKVDPSMSNYIEGLRQSIDILRTDKVRK